MAKLDLKSLASFGFLDVHLRERRQSANAWNIYLKRGHSTIFLDGDQLRSILATSGIIPPNKGPSLQSFISGCVGTFQNGFVIISAVAMLDEARRWFKQNIENGFEVTKCSRN